MKPLSRRQIDDIWMHSSDIYDFAKRIQRASDDKSLSAMRELAPHAASDAERQALRGLQSGDTLVP